MVGKSQSVNYARVVEASWEGVGWGESVYGESLLRIRFRDAASMLCVAQREGG